MLSKYENGWKVLIKVSLLSIKFAAGGCYKTNEHVIYVTTYQPELEKFSPSQTQVNLRFS